MTNHLTPLGISLAMLEARGLTLQLEAQTLQVVQTDPCGREYQLTPAAAQAWQSMKQAAQKDGIALLMVSAFRSVSRQIEIIQNKLDAGESIHQILTVCAAPGYSEHHTGRAIDIATPELPELEECFENSLAFTWLQQHASAFGFFLSYPKENLSGYQYEPWHWCFDPDKSDSRSS
jgi:D-alanyl-D-alanine carboxypeptidase